MTDELKKESTTTPVENDENDAKVRVSVLGSDVTSEPTEGEAGEKPAKAKTAKGKKKGKAVRQLSHGKAYVQATYNNTIITITDLNGNTVAWSSAGSCGFKGPKKATPYAASIVVKKVMEKAEPYGLTEVNVYISGVGQGRDSAVRSLNAHGLNILSIRDVTPIPHNGCRKPRARRV